MEKIEENRFETEEDCLAYVSGGKPEDAYGRLSEVPETLRSYEVCYRAVSRNGAALQFVPEEHKAETLCWVALSNNGGAGGYLPVSLYSSYDNCLRICRVYYFDRELGHLRRGGCRISKLVPEEWREKILDELELPMSLLGL
jgi:hypothetical protein